MTCSSVRAKTHNAYTCSGTSGGVLVAPIPGSPKACPQGEEIGSTAAALQPKRPRSCPRFHPSCSLLPAALRSRPQERPKHVSGNHAHLKHLIILIVRKRFKKKATPPTALLQTANNVAAQQWPRTVLARHVASPIIGASMRRCRKAGCRCGSNSIEFHPTNTRLSVYTYDSWR